MDDEIEMDLALIERNTVEVVTKEEVIELLKTKPRGKRKAYIGFEPSGTVHVGWIICANKIRDLVKAGFKVVVYLADWHAYLNNKYGGNIESIRICAEYMKDAFEALGVSRDMVEFKYAYELLNSIDYWEKVMRIGKVSTMKRVRRALTIMGRKEEEAEGDAAKFIYPLMQAADIFQLDVDIAYGGMDQRKAHMLARDAAEKLGYRKPIALHTPLLSGLDVNGRMDPLEVKMSKSKPDSGIFIHDTPADLKRKIKKAYCPEGIVEGNPVLELAHYVILPTLGALKIKRPEKWGGDLTFETYEELEKTFAEKKLHPMDLKTGVTNAMIEILAPVAEYFEKHPTNYAKVKDLAVKR